MHDKHLYPLNHLHSLYNVVSYILLGKIHDKNTNRGNFIIENLNLVPGTGLVSVFYMHTYAHACTGIHILVWGFF